MERRTITQDSVVIAWATSVNLAQLGARLEAYVETKAAITTFRLAARYTRLAGGNALNEETISIIASKLQDIVFEPKMKTWNQIENCLDNTCATLSHASPDLSHCLAHGDLDKTDKRVEKMLKVDSAIQHNYNVWIYCEKLSVLDGSSRFAKCIRIFEQDFGILAYFMIEKFYDPYEIAFVHAQAFLTLPLFQAPVASHPAIGKACISVCGTIDPSRLMLSKAQLRRFGVAFNILQLHPFDPEEDESGSGDKPRVREPSDWGCGPEDGDDQGHDDNGTDGDKSCENSAAAQGDQMSKHGGIHQSNESFSEPKTE